MHSPVSSSKQVKGLEDFIKKVLATPELYKKKKEEYLSEISNQNTKNTYVKFVSNSCSAILDSKDQPPMVKLNYLRFLKEAVDLKDKELLILVQENNLKTILKIALYRKESKDDDRGQTYFLDKGHSGKDRSELEMIGKSLLRLSLECIKYWAEMFPVDPSNESSESAFIAAYKDLQDQQVKFPDEDSVAYFKKYLKEKKKSGQIDSRYSKRLSKRFSIIDPVGKEQEGLLAITNHEKLKDLARDSADLNNVFLSINKQINDSKSRKEMFIKFLSSDRLEFDQIELLKTVQADIITTIKEMEILINGHSKEPTLEVKDRLSQLEKEKQSLETILNNIKSYHIHVFTIQELRARYNVKEPIELMRYSEEERKSIDNSGNRGSNSKTNTKKEGGKHSTKLLKFASSDNQQLPVKSHPEETRLRKKSEPLKLMLNVNEVKEVKEEKEDMEMSCLIGNKNPPLGEIKLEKRFLSENQSLNSFYSKNSINLKASFKEMFENDEKFKIEPKVKGLTSSGSKVKGGNQFNDLGYSMLHKSLSQESERELSSMREKVKKLTQDYEIAVREKNEMREYMEQEIDELRINMQSILSNLEQECSNLQTQLMLREKAFDDLNEQNIELNVQNRGLMEHNRELQERKNTASNDESQIETGNSIEELKSLKGQIEVLVTRNEEINEKNLSLKEQYNSLELGYRSMYESHVILLELNRNLEEENQRLKAELNSLRKNEITPNSASILNSKKYNMQGNFNDMTKENAPEYGANQGYKSPKNNINFSLTTPSSQQHQHVRMSNYLKSESSKPSIKNKSINISEKLSPKTELQVLPAKTNNGWNSKVFEKINSVKYPEFEENFDSKSITSVGTDFDLNMKGVDLTFPPQNMGYEFEQYNNKTGSLQVYDKLYSDGVLKALQFDKKALDNFKYNCLTSEGVIFDDAIIQVKFYIQANEDSEQGLLKFILQIFNKTKDTLRGIEVKYQHSEDVLIKNELKDNTPDIPASLNIKQTISICIQNHPLKPIVGLMYFSLKGENFMRTFPLPLCLNRYMTGSQPKVQTFYEVWSSAKREIPKSILFSNRFALNSKLARSIQEIQSHIPILALVGNGKEKENSSRKSKLIGQFELRNSQYESKFFFLKITMKPERLARIQVLPTDMAHSDVASEFLNTLYFLFAR